MKHRKIIILMSILFLIYLALQKGQREPIENLLVISGIGVDIEKNENNKVEYTLSIPAYTFEGDKVSSKIYSTTADTIPETRQRRQIKIDRRYITGFERVYIVSEDYAREGIRAFIDILQKNPWVNDEGYLVICKGKAEDVIKLTVKGYPSSADFLDRMIYASASYNFFPKKFALINAYKYIDAEGINPNFPYIEIKNGQLEITGVAHFEYDKMVTKYSLDDTKVINMLREDAVKGIIDIKNDNQYVSYDAVVKKKIKCIVKDGKYYFTINLNFAGDIISNELYANMLEEPSKTKELEGQLEKEIQKRCMDYIDKMQNEDHLDVINLSECAIAHTGRHTGTDWNKVVANAQIDVKVKAKIDGYGRGDY